MKKNAAPKNVIKKNSFNFKEKWKNLVFISKCSSQNRIFEKKKH